MLADLGSLLETHDLDIADITLETVLDHILEKRASTSETATSPVIILFHISETNEWLLQHSMRWRLSLLTRAPFHFNMDMARSRNGRYMLVTTFDGTHRPELLESFGSVGCCLIQLQSPSTAMYTDVLRGLVKKAHSPGIQCDQGLETYEPPEPLACALSDCGDNLQLFSMLLYKIGCYGSHTEKLGRFRWNRFFNNLQNLSSDIRHVSSWMSNTVDFVNRNFSKYTHSLLKFNSEQLLRVMSPALLGLPIMENPKTEIKGSKRSWEQLEKEGLITLRDRHVELPFIFIQIYTQHLRDQGVKLTNLIDILKEIRSGSSWRQNEKCDIAVVILQILHWYFNHPNRETFRLEEMFWGVKFEGTVASTELKVPKAIRFLIVGQHS
jgi:hypothetical protein